ncbi:MAG TPA: sporulation protein [Candidatus Atribacteria bacterium]|nr:sporulation protein [Candidatus Atribacteria bacterium]
MAKNRKSKKKKNHLKIIFTLLVIIALIIFSYLIFNKLIMPVWERYKEKPVVTREIPYEEEKEEIKPVPMEEMVEVNLYFSDYQAMYLVPEKRKIPVSLSLAKQVVLEIINGPENSNLYPTIPKGTQLNELYIADDIAYVDLSEEVSKNHPGGSSAELMTVYSIVNTLTEIPPIKGVQILIAGNERESLVGHIDISKPLLRDEDWIKP